MHSGNSLSSQGNVLTQTSLSRYSKEHKFRPAASPVITETLKDGRTRLRGSYATPTTTVTPSSTARSKKRGQPGRTRSNKKTRSTARLWYFVSRGTILVLRPVHLFDVLHPFLHSQSRSLIRLGLDRFRCNSRPKSDLSLLNDEMRWIFYSTMVTSQDYSMEETQQEAERGSCKMSCYR